MKNKDIKRIEQLIEEANYTNSEKLYNDIYVILENLEKKETTPNYLLYYYKGLIQYSHPDIKDQSKVDLAIENFKKALELQSNHLMSIIYLGHSYYDKNENKLSINTFNKILCNKEAIDVIVKNKQKWRLANMKELKAVSYLKLNKLNTFMRSYKYWLKIYNKLDQFNMYFPHHLIMEIMIFINETHILSNKDFEQFKIICSELVNIIIKNGLEKVYKKEIEKFRTL